jgi:hypothetical protein
VEKRDKFIAEISKEYINRNPQCIDKNGAIHVEMVRLEVEAIKS